VKLTRRSFLATGTGSLVVACGSSSRQVAQPHDDDEHEEEVTPAEDLMREHGVLRRVMYLYDEASMKLDGNQPVPLDALVAGASIIRRVIEDYHEKLEEDFVFPLFERAGKMADLTATLRRQHQAGRAVTDSIVALTKSPDVDRAKLSRLLRSFNHMYRPHAAREDTVLFPALRELMGEHAYEELGEQLEEKETQILGAHGFEHAVVEVSKLEEAFGVADLAALTASA
jgi:hemerythrin-like domain-containing protein